MLNVVGCLCGKWEGGNSNKDNDVNNEDNNRNHDDGEDKLTMTFVFDATTNLVVGFIPG